MVKVTKLAKTVNSQINPNTTQRIDWKNCDKALTNTDGTYATSYSTRKKVKNNYVDNHPWTLTAHKFDLDIPSNAYVKSIKFQVRMRTKGSYKTWKYPQARFNIYGSAYSNKYDGNRVVNTTGWEKGIYFVHENKNLSSSWKTYTYTMNEANIKKGGFKSKHFNAEVMGVDLQFYNAVFFADGSTKKEATVEIDVAWVKIEIEYDLPTYNITYSEVANQVPTGEKFCTTAKYTQSTKANDGNQILDVNIPWGTELESATASNNQFNSSTMKWTVSANGKHTETLKLCLKPYIEGVNTLSIGNGNVGTYPFDYFPYRFLTDGYDDLNIGFKSEIHKGHRACCSIDIEGYSDDTSVSYTVAFDKNVEYIDWTLENSTDGVNIADTDGNTVTLTVPANERFSAYLSFCFIPKVQGTNSLTVSSSDTGHQKSVDFNVLAPYVYHIGSGYTDGEQYATFDDDEIVFKNYRIATEIETDSTVIPIRSDEYDAIMHIPACNIRLHKWDELDYIGCVPLEHLHFDPKSTYKDKLLDTHYKNKRYMGKQLASDEDITLNVRLHPQQVTTIQGLIDMDKPIPINANHKCFEGDSLNHRGWAEIYGITTTRTNPHWYKCDIDVKYLTHNLHTRFKINKGNKVNNQETNEIMVESFGSGEPLSSGDIYNDFFSVDTDGTYMYQEDEVIDVDYLTSEGHEVIYDGTNVYYVDENDVHIDLGLATDFVAYLEESNYIVVTPLVVDEPIKVKGSIDIPDSQRNMFSIDNNQYIDIQTRNPLSHSSEVIFEWSSVLLDELEENNVERIIELVGSDGNPVFKYQYAGFEYEYDNTSETPTIESVKANPIAYVRENGDWTPLTEEIKLMVDVESGGLSDDEESDDDYEDYNDDASELIFGSRLHFIIDNNKLRVVDEGFNSREWELSDLNIEGDTLTWRTSWINRNVDGESNDVVCFMNFIVLDTLYTSQYADKYSKLIVSPFPVADKKLVFSREAEEGTVYYYEDDGGEFSYMVEPYYQYKNGTDLVTDSGISIFNLNYGYKLVYIQNGLVRLGFDRIDDKGRMFLGKYDPKSDSYITTHQFSLGKYTDVNLKSISDDKIEIQASDSIFTIWRGHPYIMINHSSEDLLIDTRFNQVWAEKVGSDDALEYPTYWDLMNSANLLPACVGGTKEIRSTCVDVESIDNEDKTTAPSLEFTNTFDDIVVSEEKTFELSSTQTDFSETIDLVSHQGAFGEYEISIDTDNNIPYAISLGLDKDIIQSSENTVLSAYVTNYEGNPIANRQVEFIQKNQQVYNYVGLTLTSTTDDVWTVDNDALFVVGSNYTRLRSESGTKYAWTQRAGTSSSAYDWNKDSVVEFDVVTVNGTVRLYLTTSSYGTSDYKVFSHTLSSNTHIKLVYGNGEIQYWIDGVLESTTPFDTKITTHRIGLSVTEGSYVDFKNFTITGDKPIGTASTDDNGYATYTWSSLGKGRTQLSAKANTIYSNTIELMDNVVYDMGIISNHNDIWYYSSSNTVLGRNNTYSRIYEVTSGTSALIRFDANTNVSKTGAIDFDFQQYDGATSTALIYLRQSNGSTNITNFKLNEINATTGRWYKLRMLLDGDSVTLMNTATGESVTHSNLTLTDGCKLLFTTASTNTQIYFRNVMVYNR